jgi:hypothetical protein
MRSVYGVVCALGLSCLAACGGDDATEQTGVDFSNRHLWKVGNCEVGTLTPFDPVTGEAQACGNNAREPSECVGDKVFRLTIRGMDVTFTQTVNGVSRWENWRLERSLDCANEPSLDSATCSRMNAALQADEQLFAMRNRDFGPEDAFHADSLWAIKETPWPGREACGAAVSR